MASRTITVGWVHDETDYRVTGRLYLGSPGRGPSMSNAGGEPPEPPEFEVRRVVEDKPGGVERPDLIDAVENDLDVLLSAALEEDADQEAFYAEQKADADRDARRGL